MHQDSMAHAVRDWSLFALLLIDLQQDFWPEHMAAHFSGFPGSIRRLLHFCRSEGLEVVHLRARFAPDGSDWMPVCRLRGRIPCVEGTPGVETLPFAREAPGERVIVKHTFDGFQGPELPAYLQERGKRFLLTAGLVTSVCVLLTTASAMQRGFLTALLEDCCADRPEAHEPALEMYQFIFERTTLDLIPQRYPEWQATLERLQAGGDAGRR